MDYRLLGTLEVWDASRPVTIGGGRRRALLALLLLRRGEVLPPEVLIDALWGAQPPPTAAKGLQVHVSQLRKELGARHAGDGGVLLTRPGGYVLRAGPEEVDVARFERGLREGEEALAAGDPERAGRMLREALALWRGPPLADVAYEPFAQPEAARLEELRLVALEARIDADLALGRHRQVVGELEELVGRHPLREALRARLVLALYRCGRQADALATYREGRSRLVDELGLEPGPELRRLHQRVLAQSPELDLPVAPTTVRDAQPGRPEPGPGEPAAPAEGPRDRPPGPAWRGTPLLLLAAAALLLLGAAATAFVERLGRPRATAVRPALDLAPNSLVALSARGRPEAAIPLIGRPTDLAVADGSVYVVTVDGPALMVVDARTRAIVRTVPLEMTPGAVAVGEDAVWIVDARRGLLARVAPGFRRLRMLRWPRTRVARDTTGWRRRDSTQVAVAAGAVWITDGSSRLTRVDARTGRVRAVRAGRPLDGVAAGLGALWAFSARTASILRVDAGRGVVDGAIPLAGRRGGTAPFPIAITTGAGAVWVLNANTASVSRLDPEQRGVTATVEVGVDRAPHDLTVAGDAVWVTGQDGSLTRIAPGRTGIEAVWVGQSLGDAATEGGALWATTAALDRQLPGGAG